MQFPVENFFKAYASAPRFIGQKGKHDLGLFLRSTIALIEEAFYWSGIAFYQCKENAAMVTTDLAAETILY